MNNITVNRKVHFDALVGWFVYIDENLIVTCALPVIELEWLT